MQIAEIMNSGVLWGFCLVVVSIVLFQGIVFIRSALQVRESVGMTAQEAKSAMKTGAIAAIGPSLGNIIIAVSLMTLIGNPLTMMRSAIIGSSATESLGAQMASSAYGTELGAANFGPEAFTTIAWTLCIGGTGWLIVTLFFTKSLGTFQKKITAKKNGTKKMVIISTAAMLGAFGYFAANEAVKSGGHTVVIVTSMLITILTLLAANKLQQNWLKEWALGFAIIGGLTVGYFIG
ncbi:protein of unknown function [Terribacillus aidingensis]|uniref:DUF5058 domain-containing protein n=1 Tax=Terribacillus aidingensis TaxID=586416 RepID=A0A285NLA2_9BACI|nr:DUF5058 family protein [Terribacillus aidingensis]SNZ10235.1 protein of unknown function [Terribacillus aidingensis]